MSIESIYKRLGLKSAPATYWQIKDLAYFMLQKMKAANKKGANNEAEIEDLEYAMDGQGDLMLALERADLWLKNHYDKS